MSIYTDLLDAVDNGRKFKIDLINKSLWIGKRQIIEKGEIVDEQSQSKDLIGQYDLALYGKSKNVPLDENPWEMVENLYDEYKHSVPRENSNDKSYFKALSVDELTDAELAYNVDRDLGIALLEGYILLASLQGWLKWKFGSFWFWQSYSDPNLVILRNWIEN